MEETIRRLARVLGAEQLEGVGHDWRFVVSGTDGARLKVEIDGPHQRLLAELDDAKGVRRAELDLAPIAKATEDSAVPGRVTLHIGRLLVHLDTRPVLALEVVSEPE